MKNKNKHQHSAPKAAAVAAPAVQAPVQVTPIAESVAEEKPAPARGALNVWRRDYNERGELVS